MVIFTHYYMIPKEDKEKNILMILGYITIFEKREPSWKC